MTTATPGRDELIAEIAFSLTGHSFALTQGAHHNEVASKIVDRVTTRLAAKPSDEWRPFASAPMDGTPILCWRDDVEFSPITGIDLIWYERSEQRWLIADCEAITFNPTRWRPLPAPPSTTGEPKR